MDAKLLTQALFELSNAIKILAYYSPSKDTEDKYGLEEHFRKFDNLLFKATNPTDRRSKLIAIINQVVDNNQTLDAEEIADAIINSGL